MACCEEMAVTLEVVLLAATIELIAVVEGGTIVVGPEDAIVVVVAQVTVDP